MFTGIIEETGKITAVIKENTAALLKIKAEVVLCETKTGDSISVNGVCLTVTDIYDTEFCAFVSYETLKHTTLGSLKTGDEVNLERALRLSDRLGGHIVSGHVDAVAVFCGEKILGDAAELTFRAPEEQMRQIAKKGSVAIDGVSLTVADVSQDCFKITVIPHTLENTVLKNLKSGCSVNLETDIISKYVEKYLSPDHNKSRLDMNFLRENGFI